MPITIGLSHGGKIIEAKSPPATQLSANFIADLGPTILTPQRTSLDAPLQFGLLTKPPSPEGYGYEELVAENYERQLSQLIYDGFRRRQTNVLPIAFGPMKGPWPQATHIAAFNADNVLEYYGALILHGAPRMLENEGWISFPAANITIKTRRSH